MLATFVDSGNRLFMLHRRSCGRRKGRSCHTVSATNREFPANSVSAYALPCSGVLRCPSAPDKRTKLKAGWVLPTASWPLVLRIRDRAWFLAHALRTGSAEGLVVGIGGSAKALAPICNRP